MLFADIIGHEDVKERLRQSVREGRIPHAQLLCGVEGTGKLPLALAYAQYVCCEHRTATDACEQCPSCVQFSKLAHPDLHLVFPIVKTDSRTLCDHYLPEFREVMTANPYATLNQWLARIGENKKGLIYAAEGDEIIRKLNLKAYESEYKVMLVWHPEKLHETCANHLLKIIEEPPENTLFLLVTDKPDEIIGTILSRVQRVPVPPLDEADLVHAAQARYNLPADDLQLLSRMAQGSWSRLCELAEQSSEQQRHFDWFTRMMRLSWTLNVKEILVWTAELKAAGREAIRNYLQYAQRMLRENFVLRIYQPTLNYMNAQEQAFAQKFAPFINERNIAAIADELALAEAQIEQNGNSDIILLDLCAKLYRSLRK